MSNCTVVRLGGADDDEISKLHARIKFLEENYVPNKVFEDVMRERGEFWERCKKSEAVARLVKLRGYKSCMQCKHFDYEQGWGGTDVTPGNPPHISCDKGYWDHSGYDDDLRAYRDKLDTAAGCDDFEEANR